MISCGSVDRRTAVVAAVVAVVTVEMEAVVVDGEDATYIELYIYTSFDERKISFRFVLILAVGLLRLRLH